MSSSRWLHCAFGYKHHAFYMNSSDDLTLILLLTPCFLHELTRWLHWVISRKQHAYCLRPSRWLHRAFGYKTTLSAWAHQIAVLWAISTMLSTWAHQIAMLLAINTTLFTWAHQIAVLLAINITLSTWARQMTPLCCWLYKPCFLHELVRWLQCKLETVHFSARNSFVHWFMRCLLVAEQLHSSAHFVWVWQIMCAWTCQ